MRATSFLFTFIAVGAIVVGCKAKEGAACQLRSECDGDLTCTTPDDPGVPKTCMTRKNAEAACATGVTCTKWHKCKLDFITGVCTP